MPKGTLEELNLPGQPANIIGLPLWPPEKAERMFLRRYNELVDMVFPPF